MNDIALLPDFPATQDAFGPHDRIAKAIHKLIKKEDGGRAIALIGTWGCGKSTVINLLRKEASQDLAVFVFDAWAHEGDPLRRTFLEKFIKHFFDKGWVSNKEKWTKRLLELAKRFEKTETIATPILTRKGAFYASMLFLTAIGLAMLGGGPNINQENAGAGVKYWYGWFGDRIWLLSSLVLSFLPPILVVIYWFKLWVSRTPNIRENMFNLLSQAASIVGVDELLTKQSAASVAKPIFDAVLHDLATRGNSYEFFSAKIIIDHYRTIISILPDQSRQQLLNLSLEHNNLEQELIGADFDPNTCGLFKEVLSITRSRQLTDKILRSLRGLKKEDWLGAMQAPSETIPLVESLEAIGEVLEIGFALNDALDEFADKMLSGPIPEHINPRICDALCSALTSEQQILLKRAICNKVIRANLSTVNLLSLFPKALSDCDILHEKADDLVGEGFKKILDRKNAGEYKWIQSILRQCPRILTECDKAAKGDFMERLKNFDTKVLDEACLPILKEIKAICKIPTVEAKQ